MRRRCQFLETFPAFNYNQGELLGYYCPEPNHVVTCEYMYLVVNVYNDGVHMCVPV